MVNLQESVSEILTSLLDGKGNIKVLEAGCGSATHITFAAEVHAVGIDISREQLEQNAFVQEKILGDIQDYPLPKEDFDVAVCWMVLEHLKRPKDALVKLFDSVKPGGLLILGFPNLLSFKGMVTKLTPFWAHTLFYQFMRYKSRHFPTYLRVALLPGNVLRFAKENGYSVVFCTLVEGGVTKKVRSRFWLVDMTFRALNALVQVVSLGKAQSLLLDNCAIVLRKQGERA